MERVFVDEEAAQSPDVRALWQSRWDAAGEAGRAQISKAWEYYVYCLMYQGSTFMGRPVVEMMMHSAQYAGFRAGDAKPPSYWMDYIESAGLTPTPQDFARFQAVWQQNAH